MKNDYMYLKFRTTLIFIEFDGQLFETTEAIFIGWMLSTPTATDANPHYLRMQCFLNLSI